MRPQRPGCTAPPPNRATARQPSSLLAEVVLPCGVPRPDDVTKDRDAEEHDEGPLGRGVPRTSRDRDDDDRAQVS